MTTKTSTIFRAPGAFRHGAVQQAVLEENLRLPTSSAHEGTVALELGEYQVAFVLFQATHDGSGGIQSHNAEMQRLFVLPFTWKDLVTRVEVEKREPIPAREGTLWQFGDVRVDLFSIEITRSGRPVQLSAKEFKVLKFFLANPGRVISRDELLNEVWGYNNYPCTRTVDNHILRLRRKLEPDFGQPVYFRTVHGFGYRFTP